MPVYLRTFFLHKLNKLHKDQNKAQEKAQREAKSKSRAKSPKFRR